MSDGCSHSWAEDGHELVCIKCSERTTPGLAEEQHEELADEVPSWLAGNTQTGACGCQQATRELPPDFEQLLAQILENERKKE